MKKYIVVLFLVVLFIAGGMVGCKKAKDGVPDVPYNENPPEGVFPIYGFLLQKVGSVYDLTCKINPKYPFETSEKINVKTTCPTQDYDITIFGSDPNDVPKSCLKELVSGGSITVYWLKKGVETIELCHYDL